MSSSQPDIEASEWHSGEEVSSGFADRGGNLGADRGDSRTLPERCHVRRRPDRSPGKAQGWQDVLRADNLGVGCRDTKVSGCDRQGSSLPARTMDEK